MRAIPRASTAPADIREYYVRLYRSGDLDASGIQNHRANHEFEAVAKAYRLIESDGSSVVIATWEEHRETIQHLMDRFRNDPSRMNYRRLAPFQVNLRRYDSQRSATLRLVWTNAWTCWFGTVSTTQILD